jgi:hypothetical protein
VNEESVENPFGSAFRAASAVLFLIIVAASAFFVPPLVVPAACLAILLLWVMFRHPVGVLGILLAFMPVDYMIIELGKFFGLSYMTAVSACTKEIPLFLLLVILWRRNGFRLVVADCFLLALVTVAAMRTMFDGTLVNWVTDFQFVLPYFVGRVTVLTAAQESLWARRAVWIIAILSVLGMSEVFFLGAAPRTALYLATDATTENGTLTAAFGGTGFVGIREASTMVGPAYFAGLCMIALILWWVYDRNLLPAAMVAGGLACSVTRSAWLGTALAITLLAVMTEQWRRFTIGVGLALALFVVSIPVLGLGDYLFYSKTGQDESAQMHQASIMTGVDLVLEQPLGTGNRTVGARAVDQNYNATWVETTYLAFAAEYGVAAGVCFVGFFLSALWRAWRSQSQLGHATVAIMAGLGTMMLVLLIHMDRRFSCWAWFPVGLAVRASISEDGVASAQHI